MSDTDELVAFLRACLDRDEQIARTAGGRNDHAGPKGGEHWRWVHSGEPSGRVGDGITDEPADLDAHSEFIGDGNDGYRVRLESVEEYPTRSVGTLPHFAVASAEEQEIGSARHIACHDPARVLAGVEAKRAILDEHTGVHDCGDPVAWRNPARGCRTVRLLASEYRGEPGWRGEWDT